MNISIMETVEKGGLVHKPPRVPNTLEGKADFRNTAMNTMPRASEINFVAPGVSRTLHSANYANSAQSLNVLKNRIMAKLTSAN